MSTLRLVGDCLPLPGFSYGIGVDLSTNGGVSEGLVPGGLLYYVLA